MKETCYRCKHYHARVGDENWHMHDYCDAWRKEIPNMGDDEIFDAVDREIAVCWMFKEKVDG